jgi:hypothetical protein
VNETPILEYVDDACMLARWRSIVFPVFGKRVPTIESANALGKHLEANGKRVGAGKLIEVTLLDRQISMPDAQVRKALDAMVPMLAPYYGCVTAIFEGSGFKAGMIRGVLTGFQLISRLSYPHKIFATVDECASWVYPHAQTLGLQLEEPYDLVDVISMVKILGFERDVLSAES